MYTLYRSVTEAIQNVVTVARNLKAKITQTNIATFIKLPGARLKPEDALAKYIVGIMMAGNYLEVPVIKDIEPHTANAPTPLLSALTRTLLWDEMDAAEDKPPNPPLHPQWRDSNLQ
ncbi:hypothetical protein L0F63_002612 [Massospora cicadina]|nr:hypothetical protein L0F63_002612 [Massospora cicadina]